MGFPRINAVPIAADGMAAPAVVLIFAWVPIAIVVAIWVIVTITFRHRARGRDGEDSPQRRSPVGMSRLQEACWVTSDTEGHQRHHGSRPSVQLAIRLRTACWSVRCAECGYDYRESDQPVHFESTSLARSVIESRGWSISQDKVVCKQCPGRHFSIIHGSKQERSD